MFISKNCFQLFVFPTIFVCFDASKCPQSVRCTLVSVVEASSTEWRHWKKVAPTSVYRTSKVIAGQPIQRGYVAL